MTTNEPNKKKTYVEPVLDSGTVYEAYAAAIPGCCKTTDATCQSAQQGPKGLNKKNRSKATS